MSELGQTSDPKELIPGEPDTVEDHAKLVNQQGETFDDVGSGLKKIDPAGWSGPASDAFRQRFGQEPPKWLKSSDFLKEVSKSLTDHAGTLRWAQGQAAEAIARWREGEEATTKAVAEHNQAVQQANAQNKANAAAGDAAQTTVGAFVDPGEKIRQEAQEILNRAKQQLQQAGDQTASGIAGKDPKSGGGVLGSLVNAVTSGWKGTGSAGVTGPDAGFDAHGPKGNSLGEIKAYANLVSAQAKGHYGNALFQLDGSAEAKVGAEGTASAGFYGNEAKAEAEAKAGVSADAQGKAHSGIFTLSGKADGFAGAEAGADGSVGWQGLSSKTGTEAPGPNSPEVVNGAHLGADAFAGAKGEASATADVSGIGVTGGVDGQAGAGANAALDVGQTKDGKWHFGADAGAAVGFGGGANVNVTVDPHEVMQSTQKVAHAVSGTAEHIGNDVGHKVSSTAHKVAGWL